MGKKENSVYLQGSVAGNRNHSSYFKQKGIEQREAGVSSIVWKVGGANFRAASTSAMAVKVGDQEAIPENTWLS